ncbi:MAG: hypothetical protein J6A44_01570 [Paludibacteraceae bacterium]|nr:hypothetical protein [Paludibacteraceae bacterium]
MKKLLLIIFCIVHCALCIELKSQVVVSASIDSVQMFIGEQAKLTIKAIQPQDYTLQFPIFSDSIASNLELVSTLKPDTVQLENEKLQISNSYIVTAFDSALIYIPGFELKAGEETYLTNPISIKIVDMPVDTTQQAITDIKNVYQPPIDWMFYLTIVGSILLALLFLALVIYLVNKYLKSRKNKDTEPEPEPIDPRKAHEIAYEELEVLRQKQLWQSQQFKAYYTELTEILRRYISNRYAIDAMEQTSDDIISEFRRNKELKEKKEEIKLLSDVLQVADLVKFAKWQPLPDECERSFHQVTQFIDKTKEVITENKEQGEGNKE